MSCNVSTTQAVAESEIVVSQLVTAGLKNTDIFLQTNLNPTLPGATNVRRASNERH